MFMNFVIMSYLFITSYWTCEAFMSHVQTCMNLGVPAAWELAYAHEKQFLAECEVLKSESL